MSIYMMWAKKEWAAKSGYAEWILARIGDATEKIKKALIKGVFHGGESRIIYRIYGKYTKGKEQRRYE